MRAAYMRIRFPTVWSSLCRVNVAALVTLVSFSIEILRISRYQLSGRSPPDRRQYDMHGGVIVCMRPSVPYQEGALTFAALLGRQSARICLERLTS